ncbi:MULTISPECIES: P-type conjugative transfer protein TrbJ [Vibrio harveyi group]|uniref:P-type conjugative transfer protein TrbJ n=1 Tax=Vibrio harveyi group TaxID=717610 RepID=UPI0011214984|nr:MULTISPECIES: P-type conjugative transfer protein TrbJ [Vibrio harveyi group]EJG1668021.1 P-type conjugative transfer protein TrbJ [Vibrio parahaemolyticus]EJG1776020.1 P-type conjugative transfer protein TrbJ [Vibrio parahaemolyticus]TOJ22177.1 P-type conjugative transfer protein TrbJ [Vibrio parahaemolyticus]TOJ56870.1 P-type conjugative transfer protein TrbJ [Vibrio parahaemolyticus]WEK79235.1 P-type conjugative transfer protein TrbJ [Vibrio alginolyticus]
MNNIRILAAKIPTVAISLALISPIPVVAGIPVVDGTNLTQNIMSAMESVTQTAKQIQQYQTQLQQYENQLQNTMAPAAYIWDQAQSTIDDLTHATNTLAYYQNQLGSLDAYISKFQDVAYYRSSPCFNGSGGCTPAEQAAMEENRRLASESQKTANDALFESLKLQHENLQADARQLHRLQSAAQGADGQLAAIGYANQLASNQANQLLQIRSLLIAQQNAEAARLASESDAHARGEAREKQLRSWEFQPSPVDDF